MYIYCTYKNNKNLSQEDIDFMTIKQKGIISWIIVMIFSTIGKKNIGAPKVKMFLMLSICPSFQYCDSNVQLLYIAPYKVSIFNIVHGFFSVLLSLYVLLFQLM